MIEPNRCPLYHKPVEEFLDDFIKDLIKKNQSLYSEMASSTDEGSKEENVDALKNLILTYYEIPYIKIFFIWSEDNITESDIDKKDVDNFYKYAGFRTHKEVATSYIYYISHAQNINIDDFFNEIYQKYKKNPKKALDHLTSSEEKKYKDYLLNIYKPAFIEFAKSIKSYNYRPADIIDEDIDNAFIAYQNNLDDTNLLRLINERKSPLWEFSKILDKYAISFYTTKIKVYNASKIEFPVDKVNQKIWGLIELCAEGEICGQLTFGMENQSDKKKGCELDLVFSIDFTALEENESLKITKKLTPFDKRVYTAVSALYNANNEIISLTQIYRAMGNTGRPSETSLKKINDSLTKMSRTTIFISNEQEAKHYNYQKFEYDSSLLPMERMSNVSANGKIIESAIHLWREPPMISFAKAHGNQLTTIDIKLLQSPISKTDSNLQLEDYLIDRISKGKNKKSNMSKKILIDTLCKSNNITDKKQKQRLPEKLKRYLEHYKKCGFIKNYHLSKDSITFDY